MTPPAGGSASAAAGRSVRPWRVAGGDRGLRHPRPVRGARWRPGSRHDPGGRAPPGPRHSGSPPV